MYWDEGNGYDELDAIRANVTELHSSDNDYLDDAALLFQIFKDVEKVRNKLAGLEDEKRSYRSRALKAEFELKRLEAEKGTN